MIPVKGGTICPPKKSKNQNKIIIDVKSTYENGRAATSAPVPQIAQ